MFNFLKKAGKPNIGLFIDGPNLLRKEFSVDLDVITKELEAYGNPIIKKVFLNQYAPTKLVEAVTNQGYEPVIGMGGTKNDQTDVDVYVSVAAMEALYNPRIDIIALGSRDADFLPLVQSIKGKGKKVIVVGQNPGFSKGLQRAADFVVDLGEKKKN